MPRLITSGEGAGRPQRESLSNRVAYPGWEKPHSQLKAGSRGPNHLAKDRACRVECLESADSIRWRQGRRSSNRRSWPCSSWSHSGHWWIPSVECFVITSMDSCNPRLVWNLVPLESMVVHRLLYIYTFFQQIPRIGPLLCIARCAPLVVYCPSSHMLGKYFLRCRPLTATGNLTPPNSSSIYVFLGRTWSII
jgi:hypothetical protein